MNPTTAQDLLTAAQYVDWSKVTSMSGAPCFYLQGNGRFCGRGHRNHGEQDDHAFISLTDLLTAFKKAP